MIELKDVCYSYADHVALNHVDITIHVGESVAFMGANGCGKSTLLKLINGLIFADQGSYFFDGEQITKKKMQDDSFSKRFHQRIGFIFQNSDTQLFCTSVYDEIAFGPRQMGLSEKEIDQRVEDCLKLLHISEYRDRIPYHLSGGEKRKVAIACVLSMNPEIIVLDEPMNGLDPKTQRWLVDFINMMNQNGKTILISTHNLELVQEITKRAVLFDESHHVAADLPTGKLLENMELLKRVNLVDQYYHVHGEGAHKHFHDHGNQ